jgi:hypothetical protein
VDVTMDSHRCGGCTGSAMNSGVPEQSGWHTDDGADWWLRDSRYSEPNGDYTANCYMQLYGLDPYNLLFNDNYCSYHSTAYYCQPRAD